MFPNSMIKDKSLNDAEKVLMLYYQSHTSADSEKSSWHFYDATVLKELSWGKGKLARTKTSLKDKGLLYIKQISFEKYDYYIGTGAVEDGRTKKIEGVKDEERF